MRKKIVAGNWKMNMNLEDGRKLAEEVLAGLPLMQAHCSMVMAPPFIHLATIAPLLEGRQGVHLGAQNCHQENAGAYTGEVSAPMLQSCGVRYVILGHSERREYCGETNELLVKKINAALLQGLEVIYCCGEPLAERDAATQNAFVETQIREGLFHLNAEQLSAVTIAYEPIWAIGTGRTASSQQAQDMHAHIRSVMARQYGEQAAQNMSILYGGSCKASNAAELFACPDVDGGLIGGASLNAGDFLPIVEALNA